MELVYDNLESKRTAKRIQDQNKKDYYSLIPPLAASTVSVTTYCCYFATRSRSSDTTSVRTEISNSHSKYLVDSLSIEFRSPTSLLLFSTISFRFELAVFRAHVRSHQNTC